LRLDRIGAHPVVPFDVEDLTVLERFASVGALAVGYLHAHDSRERLRSGPVRNLSAADVERRPPAPTTR
jgi:hypothetical protein